MQWVGLAAGPLLAALTWAGLPDTYVDASGESAWLGPAGRASAATAVWMATWWMTEAIPVYATALLPLALLPLGGARTIREAASPYGHELIFLFMGGFVLALAMQRWALDRRIALLTLRIVGTQPRRVVAGFMAITAILSMWVSNTATAVMMLPIALSVVALAERESAADPNLALCLLLGIAYAASIGGIGTLIGTPPNLFLASFATRELGVEITFVGWMAVGLPLVAVFLPITWYALTHWLYPIRLERVEGGARLAREAFDELGPVKRGEWITLVVFLATATSWILRPWLVEIEVGGRKPLEGLSDAGIAMIAAVSLFALPVDPSRRIFTMDWETAVKLPWGLLILFGGGLSLAAALRANGVGELLAAQVGGLAGVPPLLIIVCVTALMIFLTELTSNTATTAALVPIFAGLAPALGLEPLALAVPAAVAASCAFMLPVATPPNAVVFGSGYVTIPQMCRAGIWLNALGIGLIPALTWVFALR